MKRKLLLSILALSPMAEPLQIIEGLAVSQQIKGELRVAKVGEVVFI